MLARDLNYGDSSALRELAEEISKMLDSYMRSLLSAPKGFPTGY